MSNFAPFNFDPDNQNQNINQNQNTNVNQNSNLIPEIMDFSAPNIGFGNVDVHQFDINNSNTNANSLLVNQNNQYYQDNKQDNVINLVDVEDFTNRLNEKDKLIIIYFTAKWCGPCRAISPYYSELSGEFSNCVFLKCDVDDCQDVSDACNISSMPTFIFIKNMTKIETFSGVDKIKLRITIEKNN